MMTMRATAVKTNLVTMRSAVRLRAHMGQPVAERGIIVWQSRQGTSSIALPLAGLNCVGYSMTARREKQA
jgi:hypothetical protein